MVSGVAVLQSNYRVPDRMFTVVISLQIILQTTVVNIGVQGGGENQ